MAIAFIAEAHNTTIGSFDGSGLRTIGTVSPGGGVTPDWVLVLVIDNSSSNVSSGATYGGVSLVEIPAATTRDSLTELGGVNAYFLANGGWGSGDQSAVLQGSALASAGIACCIVGSGSSPEIAGIVLERNNQTLSEENVGDGGSSTNSLRFAALFSGSSAATVGSNTTEIFQVTTGGTTCQAFARETTAGTGSRPVGFDNAGTDDVAAVYLCVRDGIPGPSSPASTDNNTTLNAAESATVVNMPASAATGDTVVVFFSHSTTGDPTVSSGTGWTKLAAADATNNNTSIWWKRRTGSGDNLTLSHSASNPAAIALLFPGPTEYEVAISSSSTATSDEPNSNSLSPSWGMRSTTWIATFGETSDNVTNHWPGGYPDTASIGASATRPGGVSIASRTNYVASVEDPSPFQTNVSTEWVAFTFAISVAVSMIPGAVHAIGTVRV